MIRVNVNALMDDFEQAAGSCMTESNKARDRGDTLMSFYMAGAANALWSFTSCKKPDQFGTVVAAEFMMRNGYGEDGD